MKNRIENTCVAKRISLGNNINPEKIIPLLQNELLEVIANYFVVDGNVKVRYVKGENLTHFNINFEVSDMKEIYFL